MGSDAVVPIIGAIVGLTGIIVSVLAYASEAKKARKHQDGREREAKAAADQQPDKARPAWELAFVRMDGYFRRNLGQVQAIFWVAVGVMIAGFVVVTSGIISVFERPDRLTPAAVVTGSGVITQFIGATLMVIYRSTLEQAGGAILERINPVGMAVQILDEIPETETQAKSSARVEIANALVRALDQFASSHVQKRGSVPSRKSRQLTYIC